MALSEETRSRNRQLGEKIKRKRDNLGMSQRDLAVALGLPYYNVISQWEVGKMTIPVDYWVPLAIHLVMDRLDWVLECLEVLEPKQYSSLFGDAPRADIYIAINPLGRYYDRGNPYRS